MTKKTKNDSKFSKQTFNIEGGVIAGRDVIQGDQTNYFTNRAEQITHIQSSAEFIVALQQIQIQIAELKQLQLTSAQTRNLNAVEKLVKEAEAEAQNPKPALGRIKTSLSEAKETMDLLSGSITSAATLGTTIGIMVTAAIKLFGG